MDAAVRCHLFAVLQWHLRMISSTQRAESSHQTGLLLPPKAFKFSSPRTEPTGCYHSQAPPQAAPRTSPPPARPQAPQAPPASQASPVAARRTSRRPRSPRQDLAEAVRAKEFGRRRVKGVKGDSWNMVTQINLTQFFNPSPPQRKKDNNSHVYTANTHTHKI